MRKKCYQKIVRENKESDDKYLEKFEWIKNFNFTPKLAVVKGITNKEARDLILQYEWLGSMPAGAFFCVGLYFNNILSAVEVFTETRPGGKYNLFGYSCTCLARGCCAFWCPKWVSSFLIAKSLKMLEDYYNGVPRFIIAYSDWEAGEIGTVYQASNWVYLGHNKKQEWRDPSGKRRDKEHHRDIAKTKDKDYFNKYKKCNPKVVKATKEELLKNGWSRSSTMRGSYATVIGHRSKEKDKLLDILNKKSIPYPKEHD